MRKIYVSKKEVERRNGDLEWVAAVEIAETINYDEIEPFPTAYLEDDTVKYVDANGNVGLSVRIIFTK